MLIEDAGGPDSAWQAAGAAEGDGSNRRKAILLIEDNAADRDLYGSLLWYNGYEVLHTADGETGVAVALAERPDLILLDLRLPGALDGLDVLARLRSEGIDVPVVALTAVPREEIGADADGFVTYLEKPIPPVNVVREVQRRVGFPR